MNPGDARFLVSRVYVTFHLKGDDPNRVTTDTRIGMTIDRHGYVEVSLSHDGQKWDSAAGAWRPESYTETHERRMELIDILIEHEFAEWRPIGDEDTELFLTGQGWDALRDQLNMLDTDWRTWPWYGS